MKLSSKSLSSSTAFADVVRPKIVETLIAATTMNAAAPTHKPLRILSILLHPHRLRLVHFPSGKDSSPRWCVWLLLFNQLPRRGLLGNSVGMKRAGDLERPGPL